jgi:hypothetical protein
VGTGGGIVWNEVGVNGDEYFPLVGIPEFNALSRELHEENIPLGLGLISA